MKMIIGADEWWPFWSETDKRFGTEVEVDRETSIRWRKTMDDFYVVQAEMKSHLDAALSQGRT